MNTYCPFIDDECHARCVFRIPKVTVDAETVTTCRLVASAATNCDLCDIVIKEKQDAIVSTKNVQ